MKRAVKLRQCHAGAVTCLESAPNTGLLLSGGEDGRVCVYDLDRGAMVNSVRYSSGVSCMLWLPLHLDRSGSQLLIGFTDGVIRLYSVASGSSPGSSLMKLMKSLSVRMKLLQAVKPHRTGVTALSLAAGQRLVASAGEDRTVYLYRLQAQEGVFQLEPLGYFQMELAITSITFRSDSAVLLVALASEQLLLLRLDSLLVGSGAALALPLAHHCVATLTLPGALQVDSGLTLLSATYRQTSPDTVILVYSSSVKTQMVELELSSGGEVGPLHPALTLPCPPRRAAVTRLKFWLADSFLLLGYSNGVFRVIDLRLLPEVSTWSQGINDPATGALTDILPLPTVIVTSGRDGTLFTHTLAGALLECAEQEEERASQRSGERRRGSIRPGSAKEDWMSLAGKSGFQGVEVDTARWDNVHDIEDPNHLCLEDMRLKEGEEVSALSRITLSLYPPENQSADGRQDAQNTKGCFKSKAGF